MAGFMRFTTHAGNGEMWVNMDKIIAMGDGPDGSGILDLGDRVIEVNENAKYFIDQLQGHNRKQASSNGES